MAITRAMVWGIAEETHHMKIPPSRLEAHRGASGACPENTMLAFAKAREAGETVPLLEGLLHWQADTGMRFNLEMKCHGARQGEAASALAAQLAGVQLGHNMVSSFDAAFLAALQTTLPAMPRALISEELPEDWQELAAKLGLEALHLDKDIVTPGMVEAIHSAGLRVRV